MSSTLSEFMHLKLPVGDNLTIATLVSAVLTLLICLVVTKVLLRLVGRLLERTKLDSRVQKYVIAGLKLLLYILTALIVVDGLGIKVSSLVALLSVGSLGITLAAEDILGNVAGGLVILSSRPFSIGDLVETNGIMGTVKEISLNHTKVSTADGQLVLLPNRDLAASRLTNYTALGRRRIVRTITASYDAPTDVVKAACQAALDQTPNLLEDPAPAIYLTDYGSSAIQYTIYCWTSVDDFWDSSMILQEKLRDTFDAANIEMTYDHLNVHIVENCTKA